MLFNNKYTTNSTENIKNKFESNKAFIIGINNYKNGISALKTATNDAKELAKILREKHGYQVWVCLDEIATLNELNQFLEQTLPQNIGENDRLLFYFAGHGVALNGDDGPAGYLIPQDAFGGDTNSYLPMTKLHDNLSKLPCRHFLGILDCCFAGAFRWSSNRDLLTEPEVIHKERYDRFITDPAWQIITSSASDQKALDNFDLDTQRGQVGKHSPFASALLKALEGAADIYPPAKNGKVAGDGVITATELYLYLRDSIEIPTEKYNLRQTPGIWCLNKHDKGEYIFLSPGHELNLPPAPPLDESKNPYRGLKSFEEKHSELFFGRSELIQKLQYFVRNHPLTVVLGASGSGKSSLIKAGLIPQLKKEHAEKWYTLSTIRPGETPFQALNNALENAKLPKVDLQNQTYNLSYSIAAWVKNNPASKLLIFIDQCEELITLCNSETDRKEFFQQILVAIKEHRDKLRVVLTLRSDFEPQIRDAGLKYVPSDFQWGNTLLESHWQSGRFIVPAMTRGELREAIEKPVEKQVMFFQPHDLVEQLIDEVDNMPGALPLLSFSLSELFLKYLHRQREAKNKGTTIDRSLTIEDYQELGGVIQSLTKRADEEYQTLVKENPAYEQVIRHVMLRMISLNGGELARRRVPLSELEYPPEKNKLVKELIERFSKARLLVQGQDALGNPYVEPAHDALIRGWEKLLSWKQEQQESLILQRRLTPAAEEWKTQQQSRFLWNNNPRLDLLKKELDSDDNWLNKLEAEFVRRSVKRKNFTTRRNWGIAIATILGLSGLSIAALIGQRNARIEQISASIRASQASLFSNQELDALINSLKAAKTLKQPLLQGIFQPNQQLQSQVKSTLRSAVYQTREINKWKGMTNEQFSRDISFNPNGELMLAKRNEIGNVILQNLSNNTQKLLEGHQGIVGNGITFSNDGSLLATADKKGKIRLWNLGCLSESQKQCSIEFTQEYGDEITPEILFSPDNKKLAIIEASYQGTMRNRFITKVSLWDISSNQPKLLEPSIGFDRYKAVGFSANNQLIVANLNEDYSGLNFYEYMSGGKLSLELIQQDIEGTVIDSYLNFSAGNKQLIVLGNKLNLEYSNQQGQPLDDDNKGYISFGPKGNLVASFAEQNNIKITNLDNQTLFELKGHQGSILKLDFSNDGKQLASISTDNTLRLWNTADKQLISIQDELPQSQQVKFSQDSDEKDIRVIFKQEIYSLGAYYVQDKSGKLLFKTDLLEKANMYAYKLSPDDSLLVTAHLDGIRFWDSSGREIYKFKPHENKIEGLQFSDDGKVLAIKSCAEANSISSDCNSMAYVQLKQLDELFVQGCDWVGNYLKNNPDVDEIDRNICSSRK